ncbi:Na/Pi cotransporter family protein [Sporomusa sp. KB1]|uniref:Na/Pi cotransporter family protein n=1 Tax=Sporomusa sp. KB1 TaxID=943346 RepID=UPI00119FA68D|nr:Na/Pi symporter [Sporomusa sp. KB1]TWH45700.1 phosphate:Na+ symporter [Sporomusa sp. KB1]
MLAVFLGIGMLLGGIFVMRYGLKKALWHRLYIALEKLTKTPWRGLLLGTVTAAAFQSSTTVCLITIGLVSADYMSFRQALGIILGANIGTCSTLGLVNLTLPSNYIWVLMLFCFVLGIFRRMRYVSFACIGLLSMFAGIELLVQGIASISELEQVTEYLILAKTQPFYGILGGLIVTIVFQSSSAATALLMVLADRGVVDITTAVYIVYGNNIGSCVSSVVFSAVAPLAARRVALSHILLNVLGVVSFLPITQFFIIVAEWITIDFSGQVAAIHILFNLLSSIAGLLLFDQFTKLVFFLIPKSK